METAQKFTLNVLILYADACTSLWEKSTFQRKKVYGFSNMKFLKEFHVSKLLILTREVCSIQYLRSRL